MLITRAVTVRGVPTLRLPDTIEISRPLFMRTASVCNAATRGRQRVVYELVVSPRSDLLSLPEFTWRAGVGHGPPQRVFRAAATETTRG
jgi:hypothetical protein